MIMNKGIRLGITMSLLAAGGLYMAPSVAAAENQEAAQDLGEVVVTANRTR